MDDQHFDDIIKNKVGDFEGPAYNPTSLAALHHQMASLAAVPWYVNYRSALLTGTGMVFCTLLILWSQWYWNSQGTRMINDGNKVATEQQQEIRSLMDELAQLKTTLRDTVHIIEYRDNNSLSYTMLLDRIASLEHEIRELNKNQKLSQAESNSSTAFPTLEDWTPYPSMESNHWAHTSRLTPRVYESKSQRAMMDNSLTATESKSFSGQRLSAKTLRSLEAHYQKGVGIKLGPALEISTGIIPHANSKPAAGYGLLADFILSPSLSLETGGIFTRRAYDIIDPAGLTYYPLPGVDVSAGDLLKAEVDSWMVEFPLYLKYRYPVSLKTHWLAAIGYSPILYTKQIFEYNYVFDDGSGNSNYLITSTHKSNEVTLYPGTVNTSIGLSHQLKNKKILEVSLFYKHSLEAMGIEQAKSNFLGVRGAYWFTAR